MKTTSVFISVLRSFKHLLNSIVAYKIDRKLIVRIILISVTVFYAINLFPDLAELSPDLNDDVFHYSLCESMKGEILSGGNPIDHWVPYWSMGYPVFHYYQHLPHLVVVLIYFLLFKLVPMAIVYRTILYLLIVFYPLILYFCLRSMRLSRMSAAGAAIFALGMSNINGYGFELGSFIWRGSGLLTQLWAMVLFPITISSIYRTMDEKKGYARSVILLLMLTISQVMFGMMTAITSIIFLFKNIKKEELFERLKSLVIIFIFFGASIAYFIVPMQMDSAYHAHSTYDFFEKWDSYGANYVITHFLSGDILDFGRLPVATVLAVFGLFAALGSNAFKYKWIGVGAIVWLLLYFGRPTWGLLIDLVPLSSALHLHRFVTMVHFFWAILAGMGLIYFYQKIKQKIGNLSALLIIFIIVCPVFWDRYIFMKNNTTWLHNNKVAYLKEKSALDPMLDRIQNSPAGRTYPGRRGNWGAQQFRIGETNVMYFVSERGIPALSFLPFSWSIAGDFSDNFNEFELSHYNMFNIKYVLAHKEKTFPSFVKEIKKSGRFRLYSVETTGYFDMVESPIAIYGDKNSIWNIMILWMRSPLVAKKQHLSIFFDRSSHKGYSEYLMFKDRWAYWRIKPPVKADENITQPLYEPVNVFSDKDPMRIEQFQSVAPGKILIEKAGKNIFSGRVLAEKDCYVLFKMTYHPGWNAYVDGKETDKVMLSPGFVGVKVKKGVHDIKFIYSAQSWKMPLLYAGLILVFGLFIWEKKRK